MQSFRLRFGVECSFRGESRLGMDDKQWAQQTADKIRKRREDEQLKRQQFVSEEEVKKREGPVLWDDLKVALQSGAALVSLSLGETDAIMFVEKTANNVILTGNGAEVSATFNHERLTIECNLINIGKTYTVKVLNGLPILTDKGTGIKTVSQIAHECLEAIASHV